MNLTNEFLNISIDWITQGTRAVRMRLEYSILFNSCSMLFNATEDESFTISFYYIQRERKISDQQFNEFLLSLLWGRERERGEWQSFKHFIYLRPSNIDINFISIRTATGDCLEFFCVTFAWNWIIFFINERPQVKQYHIYFYFRISYSYFSFKTIQHNRSSD